MSPADDPDDADRGESPAATTAGGGARGGLAGRLRGVGGRLGRVVRRRNEGSGGGRGSGVVSRLKPALFAVAGGCLLFGLAATGALLTAAAPPQIVAPLQLTVPPAPDRPAVAAGDSYLVVQPFGQALLAGLPALPPAPPLGPAPDPSLLETTDTGRLPRIARDGRTPQEVYARPFDRGDDRSRLVLIVSGIGLSPTASRAAIEQLPAAVVLAIDAYASRPEDWGRAARQAGHEVLATLPLQPSPPDDQGPAALPYGAGSAETMHRLAANLGRFTGYVGVLATGGGAFGTIVEPLRPVAAALHGRGLLLADATPTADGGRLLTRAATVDLRRRAVDVVVDAEATAAVVDGQLDGLLGIARQRFVAVGLLPSSALAIARLRSFLARLDEARYVVAPISAVASTGDQP